jgi:hypothetical protein
MEIKMLLCKVDACIEMAGHKVSEQEKQLHALVQENQHMHMQLRMMASEKKEHGVKIGELNNVISSAQEQIQNLSNSMKVVTCFK